MATIFALGPTTSANGVTGSTSGEVDSPQSFDVIMAQAQAANVAARTARGATARAVRTGLLVGAPRSGATGTGANATAVGTTAWTPANGIAGPRTNCQSPYAGGTTSPYSPGTTPPSAGGTAISPETIRSWFRGGINEFDTQQAIQEFYNKAARMGVPAIQIDRAFALPLGTTNSWVQSHGLPALTGRPIDSQGTLSGSIYTNPITGVSTNLAELSDIFYGTRSSPPPQGSLQEQQNLSNVYTRAQTAGVPAWAIEQYCGLPEGCFNQWAAANNLKPLNGEPLYYRSAVQNPTGLQASFFQNGVLDYNRDVVSDAEIKSWANAMPGTPDTVRQGQVYGMAVSNMVTADAIDHVFGLSCGTTAKWVADLGLRPLNGQMTNASPYGASYGAPAGSSTAGTGTVATGYGGGASPSAVQPGYHSVNDLA